MYIGIDGSTSQTGIWKFKSISKGKLTSSKSWCITPDKKTKNRVCDVTDQIITALKTTNPTMIVIEKPFNIKGHGLILLELLGAIKYAVWQHDPALLDIIYEVPQTTLKLFATSNGHAQKSQMVLRAYQEFGIQDVSEDEVDAFFLALLGYYSSKKRLSKDVPVYRQKIVKSLCDFKLIKIKKPKKGKK